MSYWCAARLQGHREGLALHCLGLAGYEVYYPRLRDRRIRNGRKVVITPALFPGYCFVLVHLQWHTARWTAGVINLIMDGVGPARVPDDVIAEIRSREHNGLIELASSSVFRHGDRVRILYGPFTGQLAIFADMKSRERVEILLQLLGAEQRVTLSQKDIEVVR
jgi:transcriptional antiterminator RfaH